MMTKGLHFNHLILGSDKNPPLILLHGWGKSIDALLPLGVILSDSFRVYLPDLPGFGATPLPEEAKAEETAWTTYHYAEAVLDYMDQNGLSSAHFLGHSFGGRICLQLAAHFPDRVEDLILMDAAGLKPVRTRKQRLRLLRVRTIGRAIYLSKGLVGEKKFQEYRQWYAKKFGSKDYQNAGDMRRILVNTVNEDQTENARKIDKRTLILWGTGDLETPFYMAKKLHRYIQHSTLVEMEHKGHEPYSGMGSHLCAYHILNFTTNSN